MVAYIMCTVDADLDEVIITSMQMLKYQVKYIKIPGNIFVHLYIIFVQSILQIIFLSLGVEIKINVIL